VGKTERRAVMVVGLLLLVAGAFVIQNQVRVAWKRAASLADADAARQRREAAERAVVPDEVLKRRAPLAEALRPVTLRNCELARIGGAHDGGYLMCRNLMAGLETAYSYGIGSDDDWGCDVSRAHRVPVHQYDCFAPTKILCDGGTLRMNAECVGPRTEVVDGRPFSTFAAQIARNGDTGRRRS
jgi:hypothetical protein